MLTDKKEGGNEGKAQLGNECSKDRSPLQVISDEAGT